MVGRKTTLISLEEFLFFFFFGRVLLDSKALSSPGGHECQVNPVSTGKSDGAHRGTHCPNTNCLET